MFAPPRRAPREHRPHLRLLALAWLVSSGAGCAFAMARPSPRYDRCNTLLTPILDGAGVALFAVAASTAAGSPVRTDCAADDASCYTTVANRQSDVRAYGSIAAIYAASATWGIWARSRCRETLAALPPPIIPTIAVPVEPMEPAAPAGGGAAPGAQGPSPTAPLAPPPSGATFEPVPIEVPPAEPPVLRKRGKGYVAAWLGYGGGVVNRPGEDTEFVPYLGIPVPLSVGLGTGVPAGSRLLLGAEWNVTLGVNCVASMNSASGECNRTVVLQHLLAAATYYPRWNGPPEVPPAGLFVRGGPALVLLNSHYTNLVEPDVPPPPSARVRWQRTGGGVLVGFGHSLHSASRMRTLDVGLDLAWHWYGSSSATQPESSFETLLRLGITFH